jgi:Glycosyltransferase family 9 (heptosyltransferase)
MRAALLFPGALGDLVLLAPAARVLARHARLEISVCRALAEVAPALLPCALGPPADGTVVGSLFTPTPAAALLEWLQGVDVVHAWIGQAPARDEVVRRLATVGIREVRCHAVERGDGAGHASLAYARALEVSGPLPVPTLVRDARRSAVAWGVPAASRLVIHPGAGAVAKRWSLDGFRRVADRWRAVGGDVTILLGPAEGAEEGRWRAGDHRVASDLSVLDTAAVIASAARYVGNDSGVSHLAGALGRAGVVLFGPTRAERWRPLGGHLVARRFGIGTDASLASEVHRLLADARAFAPG